LLLASDSNLLAARKAKHVTVFIDAVTLEPVDKLIQAVADLGNANEGVMTT